MNDDYNFMLKTGIEDFLNLVIILCHHKLQVNTQTLHYLGGRVKEAFYEELKNKEFVLEVDTSGCIIVHVYDRYEND